MHSKSHCRLNRLSHTIYWKSPISILGTSSCEIYIFLKKKVILFANSGDPDQTPHSAASDLGLHCLPSTLLQVFRLQWVKYQAGISKKNKYSINTCVSNLSYHNYPKYWDRQAIANSVDPDHTLQNTASDQALHCL